MVDRAAPPALVASAALGAVVATAARAQITRSEMLAGLVAKGAPVSPQRLEPKEDSVVSVDSAVPAAAAVMHSVAAWRSLGELSASPQSRYQQITPTGRLARPAAKGDSAAAEAMEGKEDKGAMAAPADRPAKRHSSNSYPPAAAVAPAVTAAMVVAEAAAEMAASAA